VRELSELAEQLRSVRQAQRRFLQRWAVESALIHPGLDRVVADLDADGPHGSANASAQLDGLPPSADKS
jgi:hypothetical protein